MLNLPTNVGNCKPKSIIVVNGTRFYIHKHTTTGYTEVESVPPYDEDLTFECLLIQTTPAVILYGELYTG